MLWAAAQQGDGSPALSSEGCSSECSGVRRGVPRLHAPAAPLPSLQARGPGAPIAHQPAPRVAAGQQQGPGAAQGGCARPGTDCAGWPRPWLCGPVLCVCGGGCGGVLAPATEQATLHIPLTLRPPLPARRRPTSDPSPRQLCNHPLMVYDREERFWAEGIVTSCGKMFWLDRLLVKLFHTKHRVLLFSTMTKLLDIIEHYLRWVASAGPGRAILGGRGLCPGALPEWALPRARPQPTCLHADVTRMHTRAPRGPQVAQGAQVQRGGARADEVLAHRRQHRAGRARAAHRRVQPPGQRCGAAPRLGGIGGRF